MAKPRPGDGATRPLVRGRYAAFRDMQPSWGRPAYAVARAAPEGRPPGRPAWIGRLPSLAGRVPPWCLPSIWMSDSPRASA